MKLDGIRQKVFLDRYALKDKAGAPVEKTQGEMWSRVARAIAKAEKSKNRKTWEKKFSSAMQDFKFVPGGRVLAGAGTGFDVTFYNCLPPDQEILTPKGYLPIKNIKIGDKVITGKKRAKRVKHVFIRKTKEPLYIIKPTKLGFDEVRLTGEHPVLAIKNEWVNTHRSRDGLNLRHKQEFIKASELKKGDFVAVGWNSDICPESKIKLSDYLSDNFYTSNGYVTKSQLKKPVKDVVKIDEKFMLLAGTWLGDGCITHRTGTDIPTGIQITFNSSQKEWADEIATILEEKYEVIPTVREDRWGQKLIQVRVESYPVGLFFKNFFGTYSYKKKIPQILIEQPVNLTLPLIKGLFRSDGYLTKDVLGIAISNKALAIQLHQLILRSGKFFTIFKNNAVNGKHETYRINAGVSQANGFCEYIFGQTRKNTYHDQDYYLKHDGLYWVRIDSIRTEPYQGNVYDIEVEEDHTFITGGVIVSNCFVLPSPKDSRDGILDNLKAMIEIMARGGGVGLNISSLRPKGARVKKVNGFSSGPCNWAELYSLTTHDIIQQGGSRRGALMLMLWDWHPDIEEFITVKQDLKKINGANLSVAISDKFMEAVKTDQDWDLVFPNTQDPDYDKKWNGSLDEWKKLGKKVKVYKTVKARQLWNLICEAAWRSAEPGMVFLERYNKRFNNWYWNKVICVNPCGEEGLPAWGVCNLGSLNLAAFVKNYSVERPGKMDYEGLAEHAKIAVRFQDNVVDMDKYIFPEIKKVQIGGERRIGLGTMGLGDALIKMHLRYGSEDSLKAIDKIFRTIRDAAYESSVEIAKEKGAFPKFNAKKYLQGYFIKKLPKETLKKMKKYGIRNSLILQEAPTGSTSLLSGVSSGIEPIYEFEFIRRDRLGEHKMYHPLYEEWKKISGQTDKAQRPDYFVSANDLTPEDHVKVQAAIQEYVDASISKTVNAPKTHTVDDVKKLYELAYDLGCKGIAYMREGSREGVLNRVDSPNLAQEKKTVSAEVPKTPHFPVAPRPMQLEGVTYQIDTPVGKTYVTINHNETKEPFEIFITIGKSGSDVAAMADALGRMISLNLRLSGGLSARDRIRQVVAQLTGIGGTRSVGFGENRVRSLPDGISKILSRHFGFRVNGIVEDKKATSGMSHETSNGEHKLSLTKTAEVKNGESKDDIVVLQQLTITGGVTGIQSSEPFTPTHISSVESATSLFDICPDCGSGSLAYEEGCRKCYSCGYSEC